MAGDERATYEPLRRYLATRAGDAVVLTLEEIADLVGAPLPPEAQEPSWWTNVGEAPQAQAWLGAGWRVRMMARRGRAWAIIFERADAV